MKRIFTVFIILAMFSCRKERPAPSWDPELLVPLAHSMLLPGDLVADSLIQSGPAGEISLVFNSKIYEFTPSELVEMPDTSVSNAYGLPFGSIQLNPGQMIINQNDETSYTLGGAGLRFAVVRNGFLDFTARSEIMEKTFFTYKIPKALKNGIPFEFTVEVPAATSAGPGTKTGSFDLSGYAIDLTGANADKVNTLHSVVTGIVDPSGAAVTANGGDSLIMTTTFRDIVPEYARGYFGQQQIQSGSTSTAFGTAGQITGGQLELEEATARMIITNGIGVDGNFQLIQLGTYNLQTGASATLNHQLIGQSVNLNRAIDQFGSWPPVIPYVYDVTFDKNNSNIKELLEVIPGGFNYQTTATLNPLGNVSGWNDFVHADHGISIDLEFSLPLKFGLNGIMLEDTVPFNAASLAALDQVQKGKLVLYAENMFPFNAKAELIPVAFDGTHYPALLSPDVIDAGIINASNRVDKATKSSLDIPLDQQTIMRLLTSEKLLIRIKLDTRPTGELLQIYDDYFMELRLVADVAYRTKNE